MSDHIALSSVTVACPDATALARFYAGITGGDVTFSHPSWATMVGPGGRIDFLVDDLAAAGARVERAGGTRFGKQPSADHCLVFADPVGHPFCLTTLDEIG